MLPYSYLVLSVRPASNEANVELTSKITISFAKAINPDTLNSNTVRLQKVNGGFVEYTGAYNYSAKTYTLTPKEALEPGTQYETTVQGGQKGVLSIDDSYLPNTNTYGFVTVQVSGLSNIGNLTLKQDYLFVSAKWDMPTGALPDEEILFNVKLSTSNNPDAADLWPNNPAEGRTSASSFMIPQRLETGRSYYVHIQATSKRGSTEWTTQQIYMEPINETPSGGSQPPLEPTPNPEPTDPTTPPMNQLTIVDHSPKMKEMVTPTEIVLVFNDTIPSDIAETPLIYVIQAPYKEQLTLIDKRGAYSHTRALTGSISVDPEYGNMAVLTLSESLKEGKDYTVFVSANLKGENTLPMGATYTFGFTAKPEHLHGNVETIRAMAGMFGEDATDSFIQSIMRKHSQYACDIWYESDIYDDSLHQDGDAPYYVNEYVNVQTAIDVLLSSKTPAGAGGSEAITLGELSVTKGDSSSGSTVSVTDIIVSLQGQLKDWEDLIHGHHNRGYAKPGNVVKGENAAALPEYITRTNLNENFE